MFNRKLTSTLQALSPTDYYIALFVAGLLAGTNVALAVWDTFHVIRTMNEMAEAGLCTLGMTLPFRSIRIGLGLVLVAVGLRSRNAKGLYLSILSLAWVGAEYGFWYVGSQRILLNADIERFPDELPHVFNLYGGTTWNAIVFLASAVLLFWESKTLLRALASLLRAKTTET